MRCRNYMGDTFERLDFAVNASTLPSRSILPARMRESATMRTSSLLLAFAVVMLGCAGGGGDDPGNGGDSAPVDTAPPMETAKNITINAIDFYQGPKASVMKDGAVVTHRAPIIAGRAALVRVFVTPGD